MISEPDVTLTDYGLAIECALLAYMLYRQRSPQQALRIWFVLFFGSISVAAFTGRTVHGFPVNDGTIAHGILWRATLVAIGITALTAWVAGAWIRYSSVVARWISIVAALEFTVYCVIVLFVTQAIAIINYLPATLFLFVVFGLGFLKARRRQVLVGLVGIGLTFVASFVQQNEIALHPVYFNHNALYHLIQAVALLMIFWGARWYVLGNKT